jgi:hypothetical protein
VAAGGLLDVLCRSTGGKVDKQAKEGRVVCPLTPRIGHGVPVIVTANSWALALSLDECTAIARLTRHV